VQYKRGRYRTKVPTCFNERWENVEVDADCSPFSITPRLEAPTTTAEETGAGKLMQASSDIRGVCITMSGFIKP
jgi:hypothetical protein